MMTGGECVVVGLKEEVFGDQQLQMMFEEMGGEGMVTDFLNRVVVEGWGGLSREEQVIWLRLHDTRRIGYRVEDKVLPRLGDKLGLYDNPRKWIDAFAIAQKRFEEMGGQGDVKDFLVRGGDDRQWEEMTNDEKELWLEFGRMMAMALLVECCFR
jgi:hypothetical protein